MGRNIENIKTYMMRFTYREKRAKELESFKREVRRLKSMDEDELNYEYIKLKAEYDQKKSVLTLFVVSIALAVLMNVWSKVFSFVDMTLLYASSLENSNNVITVGMSISAIVLVFVTVIILFLLLSFSKDINKIKRKLMIVETVLKKEESQAEE